MVEAVLKFKKEENATHINRSLSERHEATEKVPNVQCVDNLDIKIKKNYWIIL